MTIALAESVRNARLQAIANAIDAASTPGKIKLYTGTRPAAGAATGEALQCTIVLAKPCASVAGAVLTFDAGSEGQRVAEDAITWARFTDGDDAFIMDATVSLPGGGGDITVSNVNGFIGAFVRLNSGVIGE